MIGLTKENKTVYVKIPDFTPYVYMELPKRITWSRARAKCLFQYLKQTMREGSKPLKYRKCHKYKLHYKVPGHYLLLTFKTQSACRSLEFKCRNSMTIDGLGYFGKNEFSVHEQNIDPIIKFTVNRKIKTAGWVEVTEMFREEDESLSNEERKYTTCDIDMYASWNDINPVNIPETVIVYPTIVSFDIETYSTNHNSKMPDPLIAENEVFQISFHSMRYSGKSYVTEKHLLSLKECPPIDDTDVRNFSSEKNLLVGFSNIMQEIDPDILVSYNGLKFDWGYLITRAEICGVYMKFAKLGRIEGERAFIVRKKWESSAYGKQNFNYLVPQGRINIDMLPEIERNYKFEGS